MREMKSLLGIAAASMIFAGVCRAEEWPKWLGPNGNNISNDPIADQWPASGPRKLWEKKIGLGYSSPIGFEGKIYLLYQVGSDDILTAFDANSGNEVWSKSYKGTILSDPHGPQDMNPASKLPLPLATPTIDNGRIYSYGGGGDLVCRKLEDGSEIWHVNVLKELNEGILMWAESSSPLVTEKLIYVQCGKGGPTAVAIDKESGKFVWKSEAHTNGGYAAPILIDVDGTPELIVFGNTALYGMNPQSGATLWSLPWVNHAQVNASTPIYRDGHLFISTDYDKGCMMVALSPSGAKKEWENSKIRQKFQPAILEGDYLYTNSSTILTCMHWPDGKIVWEARDPKLRLDQGGSLVRDGDKLITMSERGRLSLVQATPQGAKLISQVQVFDFSRVWSSPLIYHSKLYTMGEDTLVCLDVSSHAARGPQTANNKLAQAR